MGLSRQRSPKPLYLVGMAFLFCLYHAPVLWLGQAAFYNAFDNLDSYVVWYRVVTDGGYAWASTQTSIEPFLGGVPKFTLVNSFGLYYLLNLLLPTFLALNTMMIASSAVAMAGMALLARRYLNQGRTASAFLALSFAFTPFLPAWGMSIAGQPLLLYALLNLRQKDTRWSNWLIVAAFPFVSNFQSAGVFILAGLGVLILLDARKGGLITPLFRASVLMLVLYIATKADLITNVIGGQGFVSHRLEFERFPFTVLTCFKVFIRYFLLGNIDVALSLHTFVLLPFTLSTFLYHLLTKKTLPIPLTYTITAILLICFYIALLHWQPIVSLRNKSDFLRMYSMERFHIFLQLLWHVATAQAIVLLPSIRPKKVVAGIFALQMLICFAYQPTYYKYLVARWIKIVPYTYIYRYDDYYATTLFDQIKTKIGKVPATYRVGSIGLPPAIAQYNGLWTIDGYSSNYPLSYKKRFRPIIAQELKKNPTIRGYFDHWGSQCLLLYDQNGNNFVTHVTRADASAQRDIHFSHEALATLGCRYLISTEVIQSPHLLGVRRIGTYDNALWRIILYEVL